MKNIKTWLSAFRLRTLPLSISGIIVGSSFAYYNGHFDGLIFLLALLTTLAFQILSNLANDYGDGVKGTDNEDRIGPKRAIQSEAISVSQMEDAIKLNILIAIVLSFLLIFTSFGSQYILYGLLFFVLAGLSIYASLKYTVGDNPYGYKGKGDIYVFIFFGLVSVIGSYFLFAKQIDHIIILPAISIGLLSAAVLNLNNMRDIISDKAAGKITLAVKLGYSRAKQYHLSLVLVSLLLMSSFLCLYYTCMYNFIVLLAFIPLIKHVIKVKGIDNPKDYDPELKVVALSTFLLSILLSLGYVINVILS
jgi:1,4-dihydroxy-2-naphthoate octaprenyltransferase